MQWDLKRIIFAVALLVGILAYQGAVPFVAVPTLGQALWLGGFAESLAREGLFSTHSIFIGYPSGAPLAFGLAGAWPMALLIRTGMDMANAYSLVCALWLALAYWGAIGLARLYVRSISLAASAAALWLCLPIIWGHAGYSMLSMAMALLPSYFLVGYRLFTTHGLGRFARLTRGLLFVMTTLLSVFMDGYTFVMFFAGMAVLGVAFLLRQPAARRELLVFAAPVCLLGFGLAYEAYTHYVGSSHFTPSPLAFFRGWGLDLSFALVPTHGVSALADALGWSVNRSNELYYGDKSVWATPYSLPILLAGLLGYCSARRREWLASALLVVALLGFYLALGPSLKIDSVKPLLVQQQAPGALSALMPAGLAPATGNAWVWEYLPGFKVMRATYRWAALAILALWWLSVMGLAAVERRSLRWAGAGVLVLFVLYWPAAGENWQRAVINRQMFDAIERDVTQPLAKAFSHNELVAFVPYTNDFMVNHLASFGGYRTYNIGGDKNLAMAQKHWPAAMLDYFDGAGGVRPDQVLKFLLDNHADAIVIPYFNTLRGAEVWPCPESSPAILTAEDRRLSLLDNFKCPAQFRQVLAGTVSLLQGNPLLSITQTPYFAIVQLKARSSEQTTRVSLEQLAATPYPIAFGSGLPNAAFLLLSGWYTLEPGAVWSKPEASLRLPVPPECKGGGCRVLLSYNTVGATAGHPVTLQVREPEGSAAPVQQVHLDDDVVTLALPLEAGREDQVFEFSVLGARAPSQLSGSTDGRVLGIYLRSVQLQSTGH